MAKYQAYAEYKDSGTEWLGEIPCHWDLKPIKYLFEIINGSTPKSGEEAFWDGDITWITPSDLSKLRSQVIGESIRTITKKGLDSCGTSLVPSDTIILSCRAPIGSLAVTSKEACTNQGCKSLVKKYDLSTKFFYYYLSISTKQLNNLGRGTTFLELSSDELGSYALGIPNAEEQTQIANFLDHETTKIDHLIQKQQQLIELLKEKRQAVISHAVTKGLDPNVPMKNSGVEWLGEVPEHWEIPKLLHITTRIGDGLHSTPVYQEGTRYYFINGNNLVDGEIIIGETAKEVPESEFIKHQVTLDKTTVLLSINGTIGKVALYNNEPVILGKSASYMNCCPEVLPSFLVNYLTTSQAKKYYDLEVTGTTIFNLSLNSIRNMKVPLPPIDEQKGIVQFIAEQYSKYETLIQSSAKQNKLLKERRTALISAAVTGKIDVRNWQAPTVAETHTELSA